MLPQYLSKLPPLFPQILERCFLLNFTIKIQSPFIYLFLLYSSICKYWEQRDKSHYLSAWQPYSVFSIAPCSIKECIVIAKQPCKITFRRFRRTTLMVHVNMIKDLRDILQTFCKCEHTFSLFYLPLFYRRGCR